MKRGDKVYLVRPKRSLPVQVVADYRPSFPAVRVKGLHERIVAPHEISEIDPHAELRKKKRDDRLREEAAFQLQEFLEFYKKHHNWTWSDLGDSLGIPAGAVWHKHQRAKRWGLL